MQELPGLRQRLLNAKDVQQILHVDRSTVYRMAEAGRLPAIRVGAQWRFPESEIRAMIGTVGTVGTVGPSAASAVAEPWPTAAPVIGTGPPHVAHLGAARTDLIIETAAALLGVMMVVTDMQGRPMTKIARPCPWLVEHGGDREVMAACTAEWAQLARLHDLQPRFRAGPAGFECARGFVRIGDHLVGMVLAGGLSPVGRPVAGCYARTAAERERILEGIPVVAQVLSAEIARVIEGGGTS